MSFVPYAPDICSIELTVRFFLFSSPAFDAAILVDDKQTIVRCSHAVPSGEYLKFVLREFGTIGSRSRPQDRTAATGVWRGYKLFISIVYSNTLTD